MRDTVVMGRDGSVMFTVRKLTRVAKGRYAVYLPKGLAELWREWHERGVKLLVIVRPINPTQTAPETPRAGAWESNRGASPAGRSSGQNKDEGG